MSQKLVDSLRREFGDAILATGSYRGDETVTVGRDRLIDVLTHLRDAEGCEQLSDIAGVDFPTRGERFEINYLLRSWSRNQRLRVKVDVAEDQPVPTATGLWRSADWHEREVYDLLGVPFSGHPDLRRILCHHQFEGHALRKDYPIEQGQECSEPEHLFADEDITRAARRASAMAARTGGVSDEVHPSDLLTVNIGPSHPAMHGALRAEMLLDGEIILEARTEIGYIHRCFEKEAEDHTWAQVMPYTDRLNYCSAMLNNSIYATAVEKLLGVEVTPRCQAIRVIVSELSRIIDHLVCVCANLVDIGALTNYWYLYNIRESLYESLEKLCGSRLTTNYARIGGLSHDLYPEFGAEVRSKLNDLMVAHGEVMKLIARNRIFLDRTVGVGAISQADALSFGFTGPCLRATGLALGPAQDGAVLRLRELRVRDPDRHRGRHPRPHHGAHGRDGAEPFDRAAGAGQAAGWARQPGRPRHHAAAQAQRVPEHRGRHEPVQARLRGHPGAGGRSLRVQRGAPTASSASTSSRTAAGTRTACKVRPPCFPIFSAYPRS